MKREGGRRGECKDCEVGMNERGGLMFGVCCGVFED